MNEAVILFCGVHCFDISPIWTEIGERESINLLRCTILYCKMTNMSFNTFKILQVLSYMNFSINKGTKVKTCIFPLYPLQSRTKER